MPGKVRNDSIGITLADIYDIKITTKHKIYKSKIIKR